MIKPFLRVFGFLQKNRKLAIAGAFFILLPEFYPGFGYGVTRILWPVCGLLSGFLIGGSGEGALINAALSACPAVLVSAGICFQSQWIANATEGGEVGSFLITRLAIVVAVAAVGGITATALRRLCGNDTAVSTT